LSQQRQLPTSTNAILKGVITLAVMFGLFLATVSPAVASTEVAQPAQQQYMQTTVAVPTGTWKDCAEAAAGISVAMQAKGLRVAASLATIKRNLAALVGLIPGVDCGSWLGEYNVRQICWWSQRSVWLPPAAYSRGLVWVITGGQTNQCQP